MADRCSLCGHTMTFPACGSASVYENGRRFDLCHADDHDCYHAWTVYGARPPGAEVESCQFAAGDHRCERTDVDVVTMGDGGTVRLCPRHRGWAAAMSSDSGGS